MSLSARIGESGTSHLPFTGVHVAVAAMKHRSAEAMARRAEKRGTTVEEQKKIDRGEKPGKAPKRHRGDEEAAASGSAPKAHRRSAPCCRL